MLRAEPASAEFQYRNIDRCVHSLEGSIGYLCHDNPERAEGMCEAIGERLKRGMRDAAKRSGGGGVHDLVVQLHKRGPIDLKQIKSDGSLDGDKPFPAA